MRCVIACVTVCVGVSRFRCQRLFDCCLLRWPMNIVSKSKFFDDRRLPMTQLHRISVVNSFREFTIMKNQTTNFWFWRFFLSSLFSSSPLSSSSLLTNRTRKEEETKKYTFGHSASPQNSRNFFNFQFIISSHSIFYSFVLSVGRRLSSSLSSSLPSIWYISFCLCWF